MITIRIDRLRLSWRRSLISLATAALALGACAEPDKRATAPGASGTVTDYKVGSPYEVKGVWYYPRVDYGYSETGIASWYGPGFHGKRTANGELYDQTDLTAAHRTLPMPSLVRVSNLENGRSIMVRINDRGPFKNGRIIDLSHRAAQLLGFVGGGTAKVRVDILEAESRKLAAVAQGRQAARNAPIAAPTVAVTAKPLDAPQTDAVDPRGDKAIQPQGTRKQVASLATRGRSSGAAGPGGTAPGWLLESESGDPQHFTNSKQVLARTGPTPPPQWAGAPWPDGTVTVEPIRDTSIFIQAGSFLRRDYATRLSARLKVLGDTRVVEAMINNRNFFRVRLGPMASVEEADRLLQRLYSHGFDDARVVVD